MENIFPAELANPCGCPREPWKFPYRCVAHASPRDHMPDVRRDDWYARNTCPACGRVNPSGLYCAIIERCELCGIVACERHDMAAYKLNVICPRVYHNTRTKTVKALLKSLDTFARAMGGR